MGVIIKNCDSDSMGVGEDLRRRKKKRSPRGSLCTSFQDQYTLPGEVLGEGNTGKVETCVNVFTGQEFAVKIIRKIPGTFNRTKILTSWGWLTGMSSLKTSSASALTRLAQSSCATSTSAQLPTFPTQTACSALLAAWSSWLPRWSTPSYSPTKTTLTTPRFP